MERGPSPAGKRLPTAARDRRADPDDGNRPRAIDTRRISGARQVAALAGLVAARWRRRGPSQGRPDSPARTARTGLRRALGGAGGRLAVSGEDRVAGLARFSCGACLPEEPPQPRIPICAALRLCVHSPDVPCGLCPQDDATRAQRTRCGLHRQPGGSLSRGASFAPPRWRLLLCPYLPRLLREPGGGRRKAASPFLGPVCGTAYRATVDLHRRR